MPEARAARIAPIASMSLKAKMAVGGSGRSSSVPAFFEILPNEIGLIAASFVGTVLYAILTSVALAFLGVSDLSTWSYGTMLYWAQNANAVQLGAWWWYGPPGVCAALLGMSLPGRACLELGGGATECAAIRRRHAREACAGGERDRCKMIDRLAPR